MAVGGILALTQRDIKRMLPTRRSSTPGNIIIGLASTTTAGLSAVLFYLPVYGHRHRRRVRRGDPRAGRRRRGHRPVRWAGLGKTAPIPAALMSVFLLAFAGIRSPACSSASSRSSRPRSAPARRSW